MRLHYWCFFLLLFARIPVSATWHPPDIGLLSLITAAIFSGCAFFFFQLFGPGSSFQSFQRSMYIVFCRFCTVRVNGVYVWIDNVMMVMGLSRLHGETMREEKSGI